MIGLLLRAGLVLLLTAGAGPAQTVPVRSGEHPGFSRLVLRLPPDTDWRMARDGRRASIEFSESSAVFDMSAVFDLIPRSRIGALRQDGAGAPLVIELNCDCPVTAFLEPDRHLVVDVADPPERSGRRPVLPDGLRYRFSAMPPAAPPGVPERLGQLVARGESAPAGQSAAAPAWPAPDSAPPFRTFPDAGMADALELSQLRLLEQIARAASQGLLDPKPMLAGDGAPDGSRGSPARPEGSDPAVPVNLAAATRADRDEAQIRLREAPGAEPPACLPPEAVAVADWSSEDGFRHGLGRLRAALHAETGRFRPEAALALARFYVHHGFGQEALALLARLDPEMPGVAPVRAIAQLIDTEPPGGIAFLRDQSDCRSDVALWAFLAQRSPTGMPAAGVAEAILQAFAKLPRHLRLHLGPRLSRRFLEAGDPARASEVLRATDRGADPPAAAARLAQAEIDLQRGRLREAERGLTEVIRSGTAESPEALAALIEASHRDGSAPAPELSDLAAAYAAEYRATALGGRLARAHVLALTMENRFGEAIAVLKGAEAEADPDAAQQSLSDVIAAMTQRADDVTFLSLVLQELDRLERDLMPAISTEVAARLLSLGFLDAAGRLLSHPLSARNLPSRRLLRARIALAEDRPNRAMVELAGLEDDAAEALRAQAQAMSGEFGSAAVSFDRASDLENVARAQWLDGAWELVPQDGTGRFGPAATLARGLAAASAEGARGPLNEARLLLEDSARARADIAELLSVIPAPGTDAAGTDGTGPSPAGP